MGTKSCCECLEQSTSLSLEISGSWDCHRQPSLWGASCASAQTGRGNTGRAEPGEPSLSADKQTSTDIPCSSPCLDLNQFLGRKCAAVFEKSYNWLKMQNT